ncbi:MFS transporter [Natronoglomus mannanivorans]|uniref:MFS transporter n=1 Tax=Natronoglomus mannanivorans TaxID=2979990 RepID=A0AAP2YXU0_9EURY|nr:MFS transporter [Halobacteria archaeon AArc-xg1-1]
MTKRKLWLGAAFLFVAGDGMAMQSRGALLSSFEATFGVSESLLGLVAPAGTLGFVLAIVIVGLAAGRLNVRITLLLGAIAMAVTMLAIVVAPLYTVFLLALLAQGAAAGVFRGLDRPVLSHIYPDRLGRIFVLYALAWSIGAVSGPLLVSAVLRFTEWQVTYVLLAVWFLPVIAILLTLDAPTGWDETELDRSALKGLLEKPAIRGALLGMALVGGIEGAIFTWLPYYAGTFLERDLANASLSVFLLAYVPGRYIYSRLVETGAYLSISLVTAGLAIPTIAIALSGAVGRWMLVAIFATGVLLSSLFPMLSAYGVEAAPSYSGPVSALTTAATYLGIATVPTVMGVVAELYSIQDAMWIPVGLTVVLVAVIGTTRVRSTV